MGTSQVIRDKSRLERIGRPRGRRTWSLFRPQEYPFQARFVLAGLFAALIVGFALQSVLAAFGVIVLAALGAVLWRAGEPPILAFCLGYQWLGVTSGYMYFRLAGHFPNDLPIGDIENAVLYSLFGLLALAIGLRLGLLLVKKGPFQGRGGRIEMPEYNIRRLFWYLVALFGINWFIEISPMDMFFSAAQIIYNILAFRDVLLFLLFLCVVRQRRGYKYLVVALIYTIIPLLSSAMSNFKETLFLVLLAILADFQPFSAAKAERKRAHRTSLAIASIIVGLAGLGVIWNGAIKPVWRPALASGEVAGSPVDKIASLIELLPERISELDTLDGFEGLVSRLSSGPGYFSNVLTRVPSIVPHEDGRLTMRAIEFTFEPRILFPDKPNLGGDSWLIRNFAGLAAAGDESGTSIGLGYMGEFYIDFGLNGMLAMTFTFGVLLGVIFSLISRLSPSNLFYCSMVTVLFMRHFLDYDAEIAKQLGGIAQTAIIFILLIKTAGQWLHRNLLKPAELDRPGPQRRPVAQVVEVDARP